MGAAAQQITLAPRARAAGRSGGAAWAVWRLWQRAAAACLLAALSPVLVLLGALVSTLSRRSPLVAHARVGKDGKVFRMLKFRTMWGRGGAGERRAWGGLVAELDGAEHAAAAPKDGSDPRVTSVVARFFRRHSLDELPQLIHVAGGTMALVGPRPMLASELEEHYGEDAGEVLQALPGLTGLWQVMGRNRLSYAQRRRLDLFLVRHPSVRLQLKILAKTVPQLLTGANSC